MPERKALGNRELIQEIARLCQNGSSGTVFITTRDTHLARVVLVKGEIVFACLQRMNGLDAIRALAVLPAGVIGFNAELQLVTQKQNLPDTRSVLKILQTGVGNSEQYEATSTAQTVRELPPDSMIMQVLAQEATEYLGPMASIICQEYLQQIADLNSASDILMVIQRLERDINHVEKAAKFRTASIQRLGL